jgi:hypothetical protein
VGSFTKAQVISLETAPILMTSKFLYNDDKSTSPLEKLSMGGGRSGTDIIGPKLGGLL